MRFETDRLIVRSPIPEDANDIFDNYATDPEVTRFLTWRPHASIESTKKYIDYCIKNYDNSDEISLVIYHKSNDEAIGMLYFKIDGFMAELGYVLSKKNWNAGIMTEAMRPVLDYVYRMPNIKRIWAVHDIENEASGKVMLKLGLQYEGILRRYSIHPNISEEPRDAKMYSLVK